MHCIKINPHVCTVMISLLGAVSTSMGDAAEAPVPSVYAPIQDVENQIEYFLKRIEKDLDEESSYDEDRRSRVEKNASTLAVLAFVLANHDESSASKAAAPALLDAAQKLSHMAGEHTKAKAAYREVQAARSVDEDVQGVDWKPVADLSVLMQQVPIVNNDLRRGVRGRRFKRLEDRNAGLAATLAALAQVSAFYTDYCSGAEDEAAWREICNDMRDSAAQVNTAVRDKDQGAAQQALDRLVKSCDRCHHRFRD